MPEEIKKIQKISPETKEAVKRKSAQTLPNRPSEHGYSADTIRKRFYQPVNDTVNSTFSEIDRVVEEANEAFEEIDGKVNDFETNVSEALDTKVDKIDGKGLSKNDYTTPEKNKLAGIEAGAQVNTVTGVKGDAQGSYETGDVNITPAKIGLGNVDNTADINKPLSAPQKSYIDTQDDAFESEAKGYTDSTAVAVLSTAAGYVATEEERAIAAEASLSQRIEAQEGLGGFLEARAFNTGNPSESELTDYALSQIPSIENDYTKIWNGTSITNLYDNQVWRLNNNYPADFSWSKIGDVSVAKATNDRLGIGKGSDTVKVNAGGEFYTSTTLIGAATTEQLDVLDTKTTQASEAAQDAAEFMMYALGTTPIWDAEGEYILVDAEDESMLADTYINATAINGRELYVMTKEAHNNLVQAGTYIPDALYLTF